MKHVRKSMRPEGLSRKAIRKLCAAARKEMKERTEISIKRSGE